MKQISILNYLQINSSKDNREVHAKLKGQNYLTSVTPLRVLHWYNISSGGIMCAFFLFAIGLSSCGGESPKADEKKNVQHDTIQAEFLFSEKNDSLIQNGEYIKYYKNAVIEMRGTMKNGKREGLWKSWYEDGSAWSETTFTEGKKNGKTSSWYDNGKKRYEGFYSNDVESGKWTFWDEKGKFKSIQNY